MMRPELSATTVVAASHHHVHGISAFSSQSFMNRHISFVGNLVSASRGAGK
jgi:hypothetical protein